MSAMCLTGALAFTQIESSIERARAVHGAALRALHAGQFEEVDRLVGSRVDSQSLLLRARAAIARGRYDRAEQLLSGPAMASPGSEAALELGVLNMQLGRRLESKRRLEQLMAVVVPRTAADYLRAGRAAQTLAASAGPSQSTELYHYANDLFQSAYRVAPRDPDVGVALGEIFLEKYDLGEARKWFLLAIEIDNGNVAAHAGLARVAHRNGSPRAKSEALTVLQLNPNHVPTLLLAAEIALDEGRRRDALFFAQKASTINPNGLETRAIQAAIALLEDRTQDFDDIVFSALAINPVFGEIYRVAGEQLARNYRFDDAIDLVRRAITVDPDSNRAHADLGMYLLRRGDESGARHALKEGFTRDPFSVVTLNLLKLLDKLDNFRTIEERNIVMRLPPDDAQVLAEHAMPLAKEALEKLQTQYEFQVREPVLIEMFDVHDDFAVRTVGLPGMVGALGACFGRVVTLDSPRARAPGDFNWGQTLWHELAHVITLQMSNNRLPRWLSEGISVWEERRARLEWGRETDVAFARALEDTKVPRLEALGEAFNNPGLVSIAYYQASLLVEHLVATYGEQELRDFIRAYGRGLDTSSALLTVYGITFGALQESFDNYIERRYAFTRRTLRRLDSIQSDSVEHLVTLARANPDNFDVHVQVAAALRQVGDGIGAMRALERAAQLLPTATGAINPNLTIAAIALEQGDTDRAIRALEAVVRVDPRDIESARRLAALVAPLGNYTKTEDAYRRLIAINPFETEAQTALGRLALQRNDWSVALRAFRSALANKPRDPAAAHTDLAEAHLLAGQLDEARRQALAALEIAPLFDRAQELLLKIIGARKW